ncbi:MAG: helix-turn-helix domain-containing protein [Asticcacaulis sp.]
MLRDKVPHKVDVIVGARVRGRRKEMGLSQTELAEAVGVTFQQVQKYESGVNRISASKLFEISKVLQTSIQDFFEFPEEQTENFSVSSSEENVINFLYTSEGIELARTFTAIRNGRKRRGILSLIRTLADEPAQDSAV